jgi:hypothetical protein
VASSASGQYLAALWDGNCIFTNQVDAKLLVTYVLSPMFASILSTIHGLTFCTGCVMLDGHMLNRKNYGDGVWTAQTGSPQAQWTSIASDSSGRYLIASHYQGFVGAVHSNHVRASCEVEVYVCQVDSRLARMGVASLFCFIELWFWCLDPAVSAPNYVAVCGIEREWTIRLRRCLVRFHIRQPGE